MASTAERYDIATSVSAQPPKYLSVGVAATTTIYKGTLVMLVAGYAYPLADTANGIFIGMANQTVTGGASDGLVNIEVMPASAMVFADLDATSPAVATWLGQFVCAVDDHTVALPATTTNDVYVGQVIQILATGTSGRVRVLCNPHRITLTITHTDLSTVITDPGDAGAIPVANSGHCSIVTAGDETRTLADPEAAGVMLSLGIKTDGGTCVLTAASAINAAGNNTVTMADAADHLLLVSIAVGSAFKWKIVSSDGCALSTVS